MTAQQQLVELNAVCSRLWNQRHSESEAAAFYNKAGKFLRDHGPALVELIEAAELYIACDVLSGTYAVAKMPTNELLMDAMADREGASRWIERRIAAAYLKLTEPK